MFDPIDQAFGDLVRRQRHALGLTQAELAARLDYSLQDIQDIERGAIKASGQLVIRISRLGLGGAPSHGDSLFADDVRKPPDWSDLVADFSAIRSATVRRALLSLLETGGGGRAMGAPPIAAGAVQSLCQWG